jgi:hypothetical protein
MPCKILFKGRVHLTMKVVLIEEIVAELFSHPAFLRTAKQGGAQTVLNIWIMILSRGLLLFYFV